MKKKSSLFLLFLILVVGAYFGYRYLYKDHRDIQGEAAVITIASADLKALFVDSSTPKILNETIVVKGTVSEADEASVTLDGIVHCVLITPNQNMKIGSSIAIKGRCIGYDDLFEIVKLDQSKPIQP